MGSETSPSADLLERLGKISLFSEIRNDPDHMNRLLEICTTISFKSGEQIIREGDLGSGMYILSKGGVTIRKRTRSGDTYTVVNLRAADNVFFGELSLIDDERRSATVIASEDSECLEITKAAFTKLGDEHPSLGLPITREIARILASRLRKTNEDMMTIFDALLNELKGD